MNINAEIILSAPEEMESVVSPSKLLSGVKLSLARVPQKHLQNGSHGHPPRKIEKISFLLLLSSLLALRYERGKCLKV